MKMYICIICGWIYDEEEGWPEDGIKPGTRWEDVRLPIVGTLLHWALNLWDIMTFKGD